MVHDLYFTDSRKAKKINREIFYRVVKIVFGSTKLVKNQYDFKK
jgi:hypothetical protein